MNHDILIFAEQRDKTVQKISFELLSGARRMAAETGGRVTAVLPGYGIGAGAEQLKKAGADEVIVTDHPILQEFLAEPYTAVLTEAIRQVQPEIVLLGSTTVGMELAPRIAGRLDTGLVTDCTALHIDPETGLLLMTRPNPDGISVDTFICENRRPQMATVRPGVLAGRTAAQGETGPRGTIRHLAIDIPSAQGAVQILSTVKGRERTSDITQARVLVAGGRGIGGPDGFKTLSILAGLLRGEIACSRACVEAGWIDSSPQVGQTGKTVRPDLYLACGISGAFQHVTGMEGSKLIISINKSPSAPIFDISDLGIVGNVEVILPQLIEKLREYSLAEG